MLIRRIIYGPSFSDDRWEKNADSIDLDKPSMLLSGKKKYHFNDSRWHHDFVFGNDSVTVEADLGRNRKILLLENGTWKI